MLPMAWNIVTPLFLLLGIPDAVTGTSLWEKSCPTDCICTVEPWPYIQLDAKVVRCENRTLSTLPRNLTSETEVLLLSLNNLGGASDVDLHDFRRLQSMRFLDLSCNRIRTIRPQGVELLQVRCVNLSHNNLRSLAPELLADLPALEWLNVRHNSIGSLSDAVLALPRLRHLDLAENKIYTLKAEFLLDAPRLHTLILQHNYLSRLPSSVFLRAAHIETLDVSYNRISKVDDLAFDGPNSISELNFEGNFLRVVPTGALRTIASIGRLTLDRNPLRKLDAASFRGSNITHISLCHMDELEVIADGTFADLSHLTTLDLHSNKALTSIAPGTFRSLPSLRQLDMRNNHLFVVEETVRDGGHPKSTEDNVDVDVDVGMFDQLTLYLSGNPLICDCNLKWVQDIVLRQYNQNVSIPDGGSIKCLDTTRDKAMGLMELDELPERCAPFVLPLFPSVFKDIESSDVSFYCRGVGNPVPVVRWILPDSRVVADDHCQDRTCVHGDTLSIKMTHAQDTGVYVCQATNSLGTFKRKVHLQVDSTKVLLLPLTISSTFVTLVWNASQLLLLPPLTRYVLKYGPSKVPNSNSDSDDDEKVIEMASKVNTYTVGGLLPGQTYTFQLCIRRSDYSITVSSLNVTTREQGFLFRWGIRRNYVSLIMIAAAMASLFFGCIFVCCMKLFRWARRQHSEMVTNDMDSGRYFVKSESCDSQMAFMTSYINVTDDTALIDNEDESFQ